MLNSTFAKIAEAITGQFSSLTFHPARQVYDVNGKRVLPPDSVRVIVDRQIAASGNRMEKWGDELKAVKGLPGWEDAVNRWAVQFREERRALELQCASVGRGGLHATSLEAYNRAEAILREQFRHHDEIVQRLKDDPDYVDSGTFGLHGDRYARTARFSYENERIESHKENDYRFAVRWTHSINPCPQCAELDGIEVPIDQVVPLGQCICGPGCDCTIELRRESEA